MPSHLVLIGSSWILEGTPEVLALFPIINRSYRKAKRIEVREIEMETRPGGLRTRKTCFSFPIIGFRVTDSVASKVKDESMTSSLAGQRNLERREMKLRRQIRPSAAIDNNGTQRALYAEKNDALHASIHSAYGLVDSLYSGRPEKAH